VCGPPFMRTERRARGVMPMGIAQSHLATHGLYTHGTPGTPALPAAQRWGALGLKLVGNSVERPASPCQFLNAGTRTGVLTAAGVARNGTYQHALRLAATHLMQTCACSLLPCASTSTRSTTWRRISLRSASVVVDAFHSAGMSAAS